ncbi:hypothetical protein cypCar_00039925, partial [Cyprinus carpio]
LEPPLPQQQQQKQQQQQSTRVKDTPGPGDEENNNNVECDSSSCRKILRASDGKKDELKYRKRKLLSVIGRNCFTPLVYEAEFSRISGKNLQTEFFQELDRFTQRFIDIFKAKGGDIGCKLKKILQQIENEDCDDEGEMSGTSIGILSVIPEDSATIPYSLHLDATSTAIILEGRVVMDDLGNLPKAMCLLFGLIYALNLEYPAVLKNTFDFIQRVILSLGHKSLKPKIQPLKNRQLL